MKHKLYTYTGTVSSFSYNRRTPTALPSMVLDLWDFTNPDKAPIRIEATGGLADYIEAIEGTDAEERYLSATWVYDHNLCLHRIEVPSSEPGKPAKIIAVHDTLSRTVDIFGPADYIESSAPSPMDQQQRFAWLAYLAEDDYRV